jgi:hypothetical protein
MRKRIAIWVRCWSARASSRKLCGTIRRPSRISRISGWPISNLEGCCCYKRKHDKAIKQLSQILIPEDEDTPRFMYTLGIAYASAGNYTIAARYLKETGQRAVSLRQDRLLGQVEVSRSPPRARTSYKERSGMAHPDAALGSVAWPGRPSYLSPEIRGPRSSFSEAAICDFSPDRNRDHCAGKADRDLLAPDPVPLFLRRLHISLEVLSSSEPSLN